MPANERAICLMLRDPRSDLTLQDQLLARVHDEMKEDRSDHLFSDVLLPGLADLVALVEASTEPSRELKKRIKKVVDDIPSLVGGTKSS